MQQKAHQLQEQNRLEKERFAHLYQLQKEECLKLFQQVKLLISKQKQELLILKRSVLSEMELIRRGQETLAHGLLSKVRDQEKMNEFRIEKLEMAFANQIEKEIREREQQWEQQWNSRESEFVEAQATASFATEKVDELKHLNQELTQAFDALQTQAKAFKKESKSAKEQLQEKERRFLQETEKLKHTYEKQAQQLELASQKQVEDLKS